MAFMQRQITNKREWYEIETTCGIVFVDVEDTGRYPSPMTADDIEAGCATLAVGKLQQFCEGEIESWDTRIGFGARLSAPGYMDRTEWSVHDTEQEAEDYLEEMYPEEEDGEDTDQTE